MSRLKFKGLCVVFEGGRGGSVCEVVVKNDVIIVLRNVFSKVVVFTEKAKELRGRPVI